MISLYSRFLSYSGYHLVEIYFLFYLFYFILFFFLCLTSLCSLFSTFSPEPVRGDFRGDHIPKRPSEVSHRFRGSSTFNSGGIVVLSFIVISSPPILSLLSPFSTSPYLTYRVRIAWSPLRSRDSLLSLWHLGHWGFWESSWDNWRSKGLRGSSLVLRFRSIIGSVNHYTAWTIAYHWLYNIYIHHEVIEHAFRSGSLAAFFFRTAGRCASSIGVWRMLQ